MNADSKTTCWPKFHFAYINGQRYEWTKISISGLLTYKRIMKGLKSIKELETESQKKNCTQIFIETPYRNNQLT